MARIVIDELVSLGYLAAVISREDGDCSYQPARPPGKVRVDEIIQAFRGSGAAIGEFENVPEWEMVREIERRIALATAEVLHGMTLADLAPTAKE